jgi:hypothetical protein
MYAIHRDPKQKACQQLSAPATSVPVNLANIPETEVKRQNTLSQVAGLAIVVLGVRLSARAHPNGRAEPVTV